MKLFQNTSRILKFILIFIIFINSGSSAFAQNPGSTTAQDENPTTPVVAQVYFNSTNDLNQLSSYLDIWEVNHEAGYLIAMLAPERYASLQRAGYRIVIDQVKTDQLSMPFVPLPGQGPDSIPGFPCYRSVTETYTSMINLAANNPNLVELLDIGDSWDKVTVGGPAGYDIYALRLTNQNLIINKPTFFLMAEIHAREYVTAETAMRFAEFLVANYGVDPDITWLLDYFQIYIVIMTNPDGRIFAESGVSWRKNTDNNDGCITYPDYGTDLNRNHSFHWGGAGTWPCGETYQGPSAASEPETQAIQNFVLGLFPDQRGPGDNDPAPLTTTGTFITLHSYSQLVLWPWGWTNGHAPNHTQLQTLGRHLAFFNNYHPQQAVELYATTGTSDDWSYGELGIAAYTFEMGTSFFQGCTTFENTIYPNNRNALLYAFKTARQPYLNPAGPDSLNVTVNPISVPAGTPVLLTATANDTRYYDNDGTEPTQNIAEARYSIDNPSWITSTQTFPMTASDGNFNSNIEGIQAIVDTGGLSPERHTIFVESKDVNGNWGVSSAVFLDITTPEYGVILTPPSMITQADPGQTITYTLQVNNIGQFSDYYTIGISATWPTNAPSSIGPIDSGDDGSINIQVTIPITATHGESDLATVTVESQNSPDSIDSAILTTTANFYDYSLEPATDQKQGYPGEQIEYILTLTNQGNISDTYDILSTSQWTVEVTDTVGPVAVGASADIHVFVDIPPTAEPDDSDIATIRTTSRGYDSKTVTSVLTTIAQQSGLYVNPGSNEGFGDPGTQVVYTLQLSNHNYVQDTFSISVDTVWDMDYPLTVGPIPPDGSANIEITVEVPPGAYGGDNDTAIITFTSTNSDLPTTYATLKSTANNVYTFRAIPEVDTLTGYGRGTTVEYSVQITNTGNITDSYSIHVLSTDWPVNIPSQVGPLNRDETATFVVLVYVPLDALIGETNDARLVLNSQGSPTSFQIHLYTQTFWYSNFLPLTQKQ